MFVFINTNKHHFPSRALLEEHLCRARNPSWLWQHGGRGLRRRAQRWLQLPSGCCRGHRAPRFGAQRSEGWLCALFWGVSGAKWGLCCTAQSGASPDSSKLTLPGPCLCQLFTGPPLNSILHPRTPRSLCGRGPRSGRAGAQLCLPAWQSGVWLEVALCPGTQSCRRDRWALLLGPSGAVEEIPCNRKLGAFLVFGGTLQRFLSPSG